MVKYLLGAKSDGGYHGGILSLLTPWNINFQISSLESFGRWADEHACGNVDVVIL